MFLINAGRQLKTSKPVPIAPVRINKVDLKKEKKKLLPNQSIATTSLYHHDGILHTVSFLSI